jgi:hypothetical protein
MYVPPYLIYYRRGEWRPWQVVFVAAAYVLTVVLRDC